MTKRKDALHIAYAPENRSPTQERSQGTSGGSYPQNSEGPNPARLQGSRGRAQADQRACRIRGAAANVPPGLRKARCIVPVDCFFEWHAIKGARAKQPFAVAMKDRSPFGIAGLWENWRHPRSDEWIRTFTIITVPANELVAQIHDRMPLILPKAAYERWLSSEPDPNDLLAPFPAKLMVMWPVSTRINRPENDDASLLDPAIGGGYVESAMER